MAKTATKAKSAASESDLKAPKKADQKQEEQKPAAEIIQPSSKEKALTKKQEHDSMLSMVGDVSTEQLQKALQVQTEQRDLINQFIKSHLKEGIDYGKIHVVKACQMEDRKRGSCDRDYHYSKPILFKPGQEKIFSLFGITDEIEKDLDAYEMLPDTKGLIAYKCIMYRNGKRLGEGRGAATLAGERSDPNSAIKKAEKRARMDACLSLGFSEYFTQDLDDPEYKSQREMANARAAAEAERRDKDEFGLMPRNADDLIDNNERAVLHKMLLQAGFSEEFEIIELLRVNGIENPKVMTSGQARTMMKKLKNSAFAQPDIDRSSNTSAEDPELDSAEILQMPPKQADDLPLPGLEVDDEMKQLVKERFQNLPLSPYGRQWFMHLVASKPWAKLKTDTPDDVWRNAYDLLEQIDNGEIKFSERHLAKGKDLQSSMLPEEEK